MKHAILTSKADAEKLQADDCAAAKLPWRGVYLDGRSAPEGQGVILRLYDVVKHPTKEEYAYPVADDKDLKGKGSKVDKLPDDWTAVQANAEPIETEPKKEKVK